MVGVLFSGVESALFWIDLSSNSDGSSLLFEELDNK